MKKTLCFVLIFSVLITASCFLSSCNQFEGGLNTFFKNSDFYNKVGNVVFSIFAGDNSYIPLINDSTLDLDSTINIKNYAVNNEVIENGEVDVDFSLLLTKQLDLDYTVDVKAFDKIDTYKHFILEDNKMFVDFGDVLNNKPLCYYDEGYNCYTDALESLTKYIKKAKFENGEENYSLKGVDFETDTVSFTLNSDVLGTWMYDVANKLFSVNSTQFGNESLINNLLYSEWHYATIDVSNYIDNEKLHLTWKRYYNDDELCRDVLKLYDPNNHNITVDLAYAVSDDTEYVECSVKAYDGSNEFYLFTLSAEKTTTNGKFTTVADIYIGDEIHISTSNNGTDTSASGNAKINFMNVVGEQSFTVNYDYSGERVGKSKTNGLGLNQTISVYVKEFPMIGTDAKVNFDAEIDLLANLTEDTPTVPLVENYYDLSELGDLSHYTKTGQPLYEKALEAVVSHLKGNIVDFEKPDSVVDPFELNVKYDDGESYETDGKFGKKYIDILMSDTYTFKYHYHSDEKEYPLNYGSEYRNGVELLYSNTYSDGEKFDEYHNRFTVYEVMYDIEKIIYTEYDEATYNNTYQNTRYIYDHSGYCTLDDRELIYELYYDEFVNKYTYIFDEEDNLEIIIVESVVDESLMYMFVDELTASVDDSVMTLPDFEKVNVLDYYQ